MATVTWSLRSFRALCLLSLGVAGVQACGGRSDTEDWLFDDSPSVGNGGASAGGKRPAGSAGSSSVGGKAVGGSSAVGTGGANAGGASLAGAGGASLAGAGGAGLAGSGGAAHGGVAQGGMPSAGSPGSAGEPAGGASHDAPITCGAEICDGSSQQCCATLGGIACLPQAALCSGAVLSCGSSTDCPGNQVCCLSLLGDTGTGSECRNNCPASGSALERQLCSSDAECRGPRRCRDTVLGIRVCTRL